MCRLGKKQEPKIVSSDGRPEFNNGSYKVGATVLILSIVCNRINTWREFDANVNESVTKQWI